MKNNLILDILNQVTKFKTDLYLLLQYFQTHYFKELLLLEMEKIVYCNHLFQNYYLSLNEFNLIKHTNLINKMYTKESKKLDYYSINFLHFLCKIVSY